MELRSRVARVIVCAVLAAGTGATAAAAAQRDRLPSAADSPAGANVASCRPRAPHPLPVVLVHGTFLGMRLTWSTLSPRLAKLGYCVFALDYGGLGGLNPLKGVAPMSRSARELARFVERVRTVTASSRVDIVSYSQGGPLTRAYMRFEGGARRVASLISLAPSSHGTDTPLARLVPSMLCRSCADQQAGSPYMRRLNAGGDTLPGVRYTVIATDRDGVVTPYWTQLLAPRGQVENVTLQAACPHNRATHISIPHDGDALGYVLHALDPSRTPPPSCD